jgi:hypothetical protein
MYLKQLMARWSFPALQYHHIHTLKVQGFNRSRNKLFCNPDPVHRGCRTSSQFMPWLEVGSTHCWHWPWRPWVRPWPLRSSWCSSWSSIIGGIIRPEVVCHQLS